MLAHLPNKQNIQNHIYSIIALAHKPLSRGYLWQLMNVPSEKDYTAFEPLLDDLIDRGLVTTNHKDKLIAAKPFSRLMVVNVLSINDYGRNIEMEPTSWDMQFSLPHLIIDRKHRQNNMVQAGDRLLVRIRKTRGLHAQVSIIQHLHNDKKPQITGTFSMAEDGKGASHKATLLFERNKTMAHFPATSSDKEGFYKDGDLVIATILEDSPQNNPAVHINELMFSPQQKTIRLSDLVLVNQGIQTQFTPQIEKIAHSLKDRAGETKHHEDFRHIPFVTIDGIDARDFDDAVAVAPDFDANNKDGWHLWVAVADVAYYVRPNTQLDLAARNRGFSIYLPDRAVHMLPPILAEDICSLKPNEDRHALVIHMRFNKDGDIIERTPHRAVIQSKARLTYDQVDAFLDGYDILDPSIGRSVHRLQELYYLLRHGKGARDELSIIKPKIVAIYNDEGYIQKFEEKYSFEAHHLIETFMIEANIAVADCLKGTQYPCMTRAHKEPDPDDVVHAITRMKNIGLNVPDDFMWHTKDINEILIQAMRSPALYHQTERIILNMIRPAEYQVATIGHYGLNLSMQQPYTHFTSPIRRYSDLTVHRALISAYKLGPGGIQGTEHQLGSLARHLNDMQILSKKIQNESLLHHDMAFFSRHIDEEINARVMCITNDFIEIKLDGSPVVRKVSTKNFIPSEQYHFTHGKLYSRYDSSCIENDSIIPVRIIQADPIRDQFSVKIADYNKHVKTAYTQNKARVISVQQKQQTAPEKLYTVIKKGIIQSINTHAVSLLLDGQKNPISISTRSFFSGSFCRDGQGVYSYQAKQKFQPGSEVFVRAIWPSRHACKNNKTPKNLTWIKTPSQEHSHHEGAPGRKPRPQTLLFNSIHELKTHINQLDNLPPPLISTYENK